MSSVLKKFTRMALLCSVMAPVLVGCASTHDSPTTARLSNDLGSILAQAQPQNELQEHVKVGVQALKDGNYTDANHEFQQALRLEPANGNLHFLNALSYHLNFRNGNSKMLNLARAGYVTALKFDEANYMAAYLLGEIYLQQRAYEDAQNQFSYSLLYAPNDPTLLRGLSAAAYYAHDLQTSQWAAKKAYQLEPDNRHNIRNLMFANAALGKMTDAETLHDAYADTITSDASVWQTMRMQSTEQRLQDWKAFHVANIFPTPSSDIVDYGAAADSNDATETISDAAPITSVAQNAMPAPQMQKSAPTPIAGDFPRMANVDVVILRMDEVRSQARGINLLDNLKTTLSGTLIEFDYNSSSGSSGKSDIISNPAFNLMGLEYNLNIFNDGMNKAEILARPSLLATEGATSKFFSGGELHVQLSSSNYDGSMIDIPIGITLNVTPKFHNKDTIEVVVHAEHSFLEDRASEVGFTSFSQTTKTAVDATATLQFGQTLILSGLSERGSDKSDSSTPILGDIPGVQYLFSREEQEETKTSILILLTPRKATFARDDLTSDDLENYRDLSKVYVDTLRTKEKIANTNLNAAMGHLNDDSEFYRQFRTGDMALGFWEDDDSLFGALTRVLGYLYY